MGLETGNYIGDLNVANPTGSDGKSAGDNHLRLLKTVIRQCFAGFTGPVLVTGTVGGTADVITITPATTLLSYGTQMHLSFKPTADNTGAVTVNVSALGAKSLKTDAGAALTAGDLVNGEPVIAVYDGTDFRLLHPTKRYIDQLAFATALPLQTGNNGKFVKTNGTSASWAALATSDIASFAAAAADIWAGSENAKANTALALKNAAAFQSLTDAATVAWDTATQGFNATVTLGGNRTIGAPSNLQDGFTYCLELVQDATGSRTVSWNSTWDFGAAGTPTLQTTAGKRDRVFAVYRSSSGKLHASFNRGA